MRTVYPLTSNLGFCEPVIKIFGILHSIRTGDITHGGFSNFGFIFYLFVKTSNIGI